MRVNKWLLVFLIAALAGLALIPATRLLAQEDGGSAIPTTSSSADDFSSNCLGCHADTTSVTTFSDGEQRSVHFDVAGFDASRHGVSNPEAGLSCFDCHGDYKYPHTGEFGSAREMRLQLRERCVECHSEQAELIRNNVHESALAEGNLDAATCVDCHGYHNVSTPGEPRAAISQTCGNCHTEQFSQYRESVHGAALLDESNPDVPTCVNCHGVHEIQDPTTAAFRLSSPQMCGNCHADAALMEQYGISTDVFDTYVSDFHGTTVTLFEQSEPDAEVNKAVCYDCHGIHDIRATDDPESQVIKENLLVTCQRCHPDATANFPTSWTSHHPPSPEENSLVYYVNLFYKFFIPGVLAGLIAIIAPDAIRRYIIRGPKEH